MTLFLLLYGYKKWKKLISLYSLLIRIHSMFVNMGWEYCTHYYRERYFVLFAAWETTPLPQHSRIWFFHIKYTGLPYRITLYLTPTLTYYVNLFSFFQCQPAWRSTLYLLWGNITRDKVAIRYSIFQQFTTA